MVWLFVSWTSSHSTIVNWSRQHIWPLTRARDKQKSTLIVMTPKLELHSHDVNPPPPQRPGGVGIHTSHILGWAFELWALSSGSKPSNESPNIGKDQYSNCWFGPYIFSSVTKKPNNPQPQSKTPFIPAKDWSLFSS